MEFLFGPHTVIIINEQIRIEKRSKLIWEGTISEVEIGYVHPKKTFTRVPCLIIALPTLKTPINLVDRSSSDAVSRLYDILMKNGASENIQTISKACSMVHSSVKAENERKKQILQEEKLLKKEQLKEAKLKKRQERGEKALENLEKSRRRSGCKEIKEEKYTCMMCHANWYSNDSDTIKNIHNATVFSNYSINQMKDISRCPNCGSKASTHKTVTLWIDKKGNCVDREES